MGPEVLILVGLRGRVGRESSTSIATLNSRLTFYRQSSLIALLPSSTSTEYLEHDHRLEATRRRRRRRWHRRHVRRHRPPTSRPQRHHLRALRLRRRSRRVSLVCCQRYAVVTRVGCRCGEGRPGRFEEAHQPRLENRRACERVQSGRLRAALGACVQHVPQAIHARYAQGHCAARGGEGDADEAAG